MCSLYTNKVGRGQPRPNSHAVLHESRYDDLKTQRKMAHIIRYCDGNGRRFSEAEERVHKNHIFEFKRARAYYNEYKKSVLVVKQTQDNVLGETNVLRLRRMFAAKVSRELLHTLWDFAEERRLKKYCTMMRVKRRVLQLCIAYAAVVRNAHNAKEAKGIICPNCNTPHLGFCGGDGAGFGDDSMQKRLVIANQLVQKARQNVNKSLIIYNYM